MNEAIRTVYETLEDLSLSIAKSYPDDANLAENWGWSLPSLTRNDLAGIPIDIANRLKLISEAQIPEEIKQKLEEIPNRISVFIAHSLPYLFSGNGNHGTAAYFSLITWINITVEPLFHWQILLDNKALPTQLARRLRSIHSELNDIAPDKQELETRIKTIKDATEAAEQLPADLERLKESRTKVSKLSSDAAELYGKVDDYFKKIEAIHTTVTLKKTEADKLVEQCEEAYRITTTKGLAAAFDLRAKKLTETMWIWVGVLILSLATGSIIGGLRFQTLVQLFKSDNPQWGIIWMNFTLSIIGLAAPIWLAWIATKQISQRFRLAEDYAFKASVAKAYEGYRKEAARIDESFEARLFSSALTRLEEAPLRLVQLDEHSSPWHEFFESSAFKSALETFPDLKNQLVKLAKSGVQLVRSK